MCNRSREVLPQYQTVHAKYLTQAAGKMANKVQEIQTTETESDANKKENIYLNVVDKPTANSKSKCATTAQSCEKAHPKNKSHWAQTSMPSNKVTELFLEV